MTIQQNLEQRVAVLEKELAELRLEVDRNDDWAMGLLAVLNDVLPHLLRSNPQMSEQLGASWRKTADRYEALASQTGRADGPEETVERLEPTKMLYRLFHVLGLWPQPSKDS